MPTPDCGDNDTIYEEEEIKETPDATFHLVGNDEMLKVSFKYGNNAYRIDPYELIANVIARCEVAKEMYYSES